MKLQLTSITSIGNVHTGEVNFIDSQKEIVNSLPK